MVPALNLRGRPHAPFQFSPRQSHVLIQNHTHFPNIHPDPSPNPGGRTRQHTSHQRGDPTTTPGDAKRHPGYAIPPPDGNRCVEEATCRSAGGDRLVEAESAKFACATSPDRRQTFTWRRAADLPHHRSHARAGLGWCAADKQPARRRFNRARKYVSNDRSIGGDQWPGRRSVARVARIFHSARRRWGQGKLSQYVL